MARIRTVKPEAWTSESLAQVPLTAERTFFGLLTQADDHGRFRDNAAVIAGLLWPLRAEHTAVHVEDDLQQLADAGLVCRFSGCDGRRYLHIVTWFAHQKIDRPSQSRAPACPDHHARERCGVCKGTCTVLSDGSTDRRRGLDEPSSTTPPRGAALSAPAAGPIPDTAVTAEPEAAPASSPTRRDSAGAAETAGRTRHEQVSARARRNLNEPSVSGSRTVDPGSVPSGSATPAPAQPTANQLVSEYVARCARRPPGEVIAHLGRVVKTLLAEGIEPVHVRAGLERFHARPMHPSALPSLVNEAMNSRPKHQSGRLGWPEGPPTVPAHRAWANPANPASAYAEEL